MKTVMRSFPLFFLMFIAISVSGCYTEFAASESGDYNDDEYYADSDTTYDDEGNVTINNHYYLDDEYRRSRLRVSFNYYYPIYHSSWIAGYYHSFYDNYYWGWHRPWWWYHYYPHYTIIYPNPWWPPIYDPWYPYPYYPVVYYPPYYNPPAYGYNPPPNPGRIRDNGSTRDPNNPGDRTRPIPPPITPGTTVATGTTPPRERIRLDKISPDDDRNTSKKPWWEKVRARPDAEEKQRGTVPNERTAPRDDRTVTTEQPHGNNPRNDRTVITPPEKNLPLDDRTVSNPPPTKIKPREDRKIDEGVKSSKPKYNPPTKSVPKNEGRQVDRPREERRSYSPPPAQQAPPQSAPPRSSGGSSGGSNNGGERKRAD